MEAVHTSATPPSTEANFNTIVRLGEQALEERMFMHKGAGSKRSNAKADRAA
jgi:hypothetical protein